MTRKLIYVPTAIAALALSGAAFAATVAGVDTDVNANATGTLSLPSMDKDADGKISKTEAGSNPELAKQFDKLDANKDGNLDQAEFAKFEAKGKATGKTSGKTSSSKGAGTAPATSDDSMSPDSSSSTKPAPGK